MNRSVFLVIALFFLAWGAPIVSAQASRPMTTLERRIDTMNRQAKEYDWEDMAREKKGETARNSENAKLTKRIRAEIEEDLKAIQTAYNNILIAMQSKGEISRDFALASASEVQKHAVRLKTNLSLPNTEQDEKPAASALPATTRKSLAELCRHIYGFITNPIFETHTGINVEHATKAAQSLDLTIDLAAKIVARAEASK